MLTSDRYALMCEEYKRLTGINPNANTRLHQVVVSRQVISLIFKQRYKLTEMQISHVTGLSRSSIYHSIYTAINAVKAGEVQFLDSLETWQSVLAVIPFDENSNSFEEALRTFIQGYKHAHGVTEETITEALNKYILQ